MNEQDIYALIGESMDDKIKLDFNDVKNRIAKLDSKESAVITPIAPSANKRKKIFVIAAAAAACLVCIFGLSVIIFSMGGMMGAKSEADTSAYMAYDSAAVYDDAALYSFAEECEVAEEPECYTGEAADNGIADGHVSDDSLDAILGTYGNAPVSDSDMSKSDMSESDVN